MRFRNITTLTIMLLASMLFFNPLFAESWTDEVARVLKYSKAAEQGNVKAMVMLGLSYENGEGVAENQSEAVKWYRKAAEKGYAQAYNKLSSCLSPVESYSWFRQVAEQYRKDAEHGDVKAMFCIGYCYAKGYGVNRDNVESVKWYRKAAEHGYADAMYRLGRCYYEGDGVIKDKTEAVRWLRQAAEKGSDEAQESLAGCYANGTGIQKDLGEAAKWYRKAAEQGNEVSKVRIVEINDYFQCLKDAEQGDDDAQYNIGDRYLRGNLVTKDFIEAEKWYRKAAAQGNEAAKTEIKKIEAYAEYRKSAEQGDADAQYSLGLCYAKGYCVEYNQDEAVKWFRKAAKQYHTAAEQGNADAQYKLGLCHARSRSMKDNAEAEKWFRKAAENGHAKAQYNLGICYYKYDSVMIKPSKRTQWNRKVAEQFCSVAEKDDADIQNSPGLFHGNGYGEKGKNIIEAEKWIRKAAEQGNKLAIAEVKNLDAYVNYRKAAEQGDADAQYNLGLCYKRGDGVASDWTEASKWLIKAIEQYRKAAGEGNADAQHKLGLCYAKGIGVEQNSFEAVKWYRKSAEQGHAKAQYNLGLCYYNYNGVTDDGVYNNGVSQRLAEAVKWFRKAAEQGDATAQHKIGRCYLYGQGMAKDSREAVKWFRKAAEQGNAEAQNDIGFCYYSGDGVKKDCVEAIKWFMKSDGQNDVDAQYYLGLCYYKDDGDGKNQAETVKLWNNAAKHGSTKAIAGLQVLQYRKAAKRGDAEAMFWIGGCYESGFGVTRNKIEAVKWYRKAAEQGHEKAKAALEKLK